MTEKELKKLSRVELLEIMLEQSKEIEQLKTVIEDQEARLSDRTIKLEKAGSIAEASLALNGLFESAQQAADQYIENIKSLSANQEEICQRKVNETENKCSAMQISVQERCSFMREEADSYCAKIKENCESMMQEARERCEKMDAETKANCEKLKLAAEEECKNKKKDADDYYNEKMKKTSEDVEARWEKISERLEAFYQAHAGLRELMSDSFKGTM